MDFIEPFDCLSRTPSTVPVLRILCRLPPGLQVSAREVASRAGISHPAASRVLGEFLYQGMVVVQRLPKRDLYDLNREHVLVKQVIPLFEREPQLTKELIALLTRRFRSKRSVSLAFLFGSAVEGALVPESDIDVLLVTGRNTERLGEFLEALDSDLRQRYGNHLSPVIVELGKEEFRRRAPRNKLWKRVIETGIALTS